MSGCFAFVGTDSAMFRAPWVLLVLSMHFVVLLRFFWYWQCIVSCCFAFVGTAIALCRAALVYVGPGSALFRAAWVLLVLAVHCVVLLFFVRIGSALRRAASVL